MKYIFIHGGPGLCSKAEEEILRESLDDNNIEMLFWNEPRHYVTDSPYKELISSLINFINKYDGLVTLIGHSSGCSNIIDVLPEVKSKIKRIIFIAPALDLNQIDNNIIDFAMTVFKDNKDFQDAFKNLSELKLKITDRFDQSKTDALMLAFSSNYFAHNFKTPESFLNYFSHLSGEYEFKIENFFKVRKDRAKQTRNNETNYDIPVSTIYGENDPIIQVEQSQKIINRLFKTNKFNVFEGVSHCPHIDASCKFIETIRL